MEPERPTNARPHVVIVGGGVGGLSAAVRLAAAGRCAVTLLEKNARVGGKLNLWEVPHPHRGRDERPFRFDTGPSLLTLPFVFEELFAAAGHRLGDHLDLVHLDPIARFVWGDGQTFELRATSEAMDAELAKLAPADVAGWQAFADRGKRIWDLTANLFLYHAPEQVLAGKASPGGKFSPLDGLRMATTPFRIGMFSAFSKVVDRHVASPRLREVLYQYATYSGASPFKAPATLAVIPHAEMHFGGWYPRGGMYALAVALERIAGDLGVRIRTGCAVEQVLIERRGKHAHVTGVRLVGGETIPADAVVCNSDVVYTYRDLIDPAHRRKYRDATLDKLEPGGSGMVLLLGVEGTYPQLAHHTKFMPDDYTSDLRAMFETRTVPVDPCLYVCATTRTDDTQAPAGCENLFVLCSAPPLAAPQPSIDWAIEGQRYRDQVVATLERKWGLTDLSRRIVVERRITPADLKDLYNANAGSIYGIGSNSRRAAFLRPPNRDREVRGLYFAGGATHPGGGLPLVALSGKIVSELVADDLR
ncbi:MAG TPA: phytoene desaturase family protein [Tepidisphaeraceae bacterium]|nr:phytoene desaturase family protein [Tepidisphaeraceae bacterium]